MLGQSVWFCGIKRAVHVTDTEHVAQIHRMLDNVAERTKFACPLKQQDMARVNAYPHLLSAVPQGARCYLMMLKLCGTYVSILYDRGRSPKYTVLAIPLRVAEEAYLAEPVFTCTLNAHARTLVVDDLVAINGVVLDEQLAYDRVLAVHDMIHTMYRPDMHLLPLKVEVRRYFAYSQLRDCLALCARLPYPSVGISVKPVELTRRELFATFQRGSRRPAVVTAVRAGRFQVTKGDVPDQYYVSVGAGTAPLAVKTLKDSVRLKQLFNASSNNTLALDLVVDGGRYVID